MNTRSGFARFAGMAALVQVLLSTVALASAAQADPATTLYSFSNEDVNGVNSDGALPECSLVRTSDGSLYGTTNQGGANTSGTVFRISFGPTGIPSPGRANLTVVYTFSATDENGLSTDGADPNTGLTVGSDGNLYGVTSEGGANGYGTVFKIAQPSSAQPVFTTLYSFAETDVNNSYGSLVEGSNGSFYGSGSVGGVSEVGGVYRLTPDSGAPTGYDFLVTYSFTGDDDGASPQGGLAIGPDGSLYGTAGGGGAGFGTLYKLTPDSHATTGFDFSVIYTFTGANDGDNPEGALAIGSNGTLYGAAELAGANGYGCVFEWTPSGDSYTFTELHQFGLPNATTGIYGPPDGQNPQSGVVLGPDGSLYGTTSQGGGNGFGTVFKITPAQRFVQLHYFQIANTPGNADGTSDNYVPLIANGMLYCPCLEGGQSDYGAVVELPVTNAPPPLLWQNSDAGDVYLWNMSFGSSGYQMSAYDYLFTLDDPAWRIAAWTDIDADSVQDLIWQNTSTGDLYDWLMQDNPFFGYVPQSGSYYSYLGTVADTTWRVVGHGDVNGDGVPDLLWQNSVSGDAYVWLMNETSGYEMSQYNQIMPVAPSGYDLEACADVDGDGVPDLIWRNTQTGDVWWWKMAYDTTNNYHMATSSSYAKVTTVSDLSYRIVGAADITGNGVPDLLWQNTTTGALVYWLMAYDQTGFHMVSPTSYGVVTTLDPSWHVVGFGG